MTSVGALIALLCFWVASSHLSWKEMDLNRDGVSDLWELLSSHDVGRRDVIPDGDKCGRCSEIISDGGKCVEYFSLKDAHPIKVVCSRSEL